MISKTAKPARPPTIPPTSLAVGAPLPPSLSDELFAPDVLVLPPPVAEGEPPNKMVDSVDEAAEDDSDDDIDDDISEDEKDELAEELADKVSEILDKLVAVGSVLLGEEVADSVVLGEDVAAAGDEDPFDGEEVSPVGEEVASLVGEEVVSLVGEEDALSVGDEVSWPAFEEDAAPSGEEVAPPVGDEEVSLVVDEVGSLVGEEVAPVGEELADSVELSPTVAAPTGMPSVVLEDDDVEGLAEAVRKVISQRPFRLG